MSVFKKFRFVHLFNHLKLIAEPFTNANHHLCGIKQIDANNYLIFSASTIMIINSKFVIKKKVVINFSLPLSSRYLTRVELFNLKIIYLVLSNDKCKNSSFIYIFNTNLKIRAKKEFSFEPNLLTSFTFDENFLYFYSARQKSYQVFDYDLKMLNTNNLKIINEIYTQSGELISIKKNRILKLNAQIDQENRTSILELFSIETGRLIKSIPLVGELKNCMQNSIKMGPEFCIYILAQSNGQLILYCYDLNGVYQFKQCLSVRNNDTLKINGLPQGQEHFFEFPNEKLVCFSKSFKFHIASM